MPVENVCSKLSMKTLKQRLQTLRLYPHFEYVFDQRVRLIQVSQQSHIAFRLGNVNSWLVTCARKRKAAGSSAAVSYVQR